VRRTRGAKDELVEELRNRVRSVERRLDEAEASRRHADHIIAQLTRTTEEQARAIRELEAPVDEPEKDRRRSTGDRVSDPDAQQRVRTSGKPPKVGDLGLPKQTATLGVSVLLQVLGNVLLGVAVWRSEILPKWAGALWAAAPVLMYVFGLAYAMTIGAQATPPTVPPCPCLAAF
jgi:hypothetical protein